MIEHAHTLSSEYEPVDIMPRNSAVTRQRTRSRCYIATVNNPRKSLEEYELLFRAAGIHFTAQFERGSQQTLHLQAFIRFNSAVDVTRAKAVFEGEQPHVETCRNPQQAEAYCRKEESRVEGPITNIEATEIQNSSKFQLLTKSRLVIL